MLENQFCDLCPLPYNMHKHIIYDSYDTGRMSINIHCCRKRSCSSAFCTAQSKICADIFIDYCGVMQNIEEQCGGIFTADIIILYLKIFEYNVLNNFERFFYRYL